MSEWRQKGYVQDSDEEDESQLESQHSRQDARTHERARRVHGAQDGQGTREAVVENAENDAPSGVGVSYEPTRAFRGTYGNRTPTRHTSPVRPTPSPFTPLTRHTFRDERSESPDPLQDSPGLKPRPQRPAESSQPESSTAPRSSQEEIQLRAFAAPSQILGEPTRHTPQEFLKSGGLSTVDASAILGDFGVTALSDNSGDELDLGRQSDAESNLSDYPSDLSDREPEAATLYATPHRKTAVQVRIPSSIALQHQLAAEEARRRHFRQRKPIQLHPYVLEGERYRREVQSRGLKPVPRERSPQRQQGRNNGEAQEEEFNPFGDESSSPPDPEIFVSTPVGEQARRNVQTGSSTRRPGSISARQRSPADKLRVPKPAKRRRLNEPLAQALATPGRSSESSPVPLDIWSVPPDSPPYSSSPPLNAQLGKLLAARNTDSLPTPSNSSTFQDTPRPLPDSDSDLVPRSAQRSGGELRRPTRIIVSDDSDSDSDSAGSELEEVDGELQSVSKKIRGVLPASWLRIDRQAQEKRQTLVRQRARQNASPSPEPAEPQRGVAQRVVRPVGRPLGAARSNAGPAGVVVISDGSDEEVEPVAHRQANDVKDSVEDASALAAMFDDRYADSGDDLASMEHDRLHLPTIGDSMAKRKRQPKVTDAFGNTKKTKTLTGVAKNSRSAKPASSLSSRTKHAGSRRARRTPPPALSVLDADLPPNVPQFLKLARRAARRDMHHARQSPRRKQIRLHTAQDTEDANAALLQWRRGNLKPRIKPAAGQRQADRAPLANMTDNRQATPQSGNVEKATSKDVYTGTESTTHSRPRMRQSVAPVLQLLQRSVAPARKPARPQPPIRAFKGSQKAVRCDPTPLRAAQLEGEEKSFGSNYRRVAFQRGLQRVDQQSGVPQAFKQPFLNPQLARFLANDDTELPPLPTANDIGEPENENPETGVNAEPPPVPKKRLVRKPQAKRIDVDAREYRQPSEPTFEPVHAAPVFIAAESAPVEQHGENLQGLWPCGTRYPTTFDITPLKSDTYFHSNTFVGSEELRRALSISNPLARDLDEPAGYCIISSGSSTIRCGPWNDETYSCIHEMIHATLLPLIDHCEQAASQTPVVDALSSISAILRSLASYIYGHLSFSDPIDRKGFTTKTQLLLQTVFDRVSTAYLSRHAIGALPEREQTTNRILSYLLVVGAQVQLISRHPTVDHLDKCKLLNMIRDVARMIISNIIASTKELYDFHDRNKLHKEREGGIRECDALAERVVVCMHTLEVLNAPSMGFWDLVSERLALPLSTTRQVQAFENVWATIFALLPFGEFDLSGIPDRSRTSSFSSDNWGCLRELLVQLCSLYPGTSRQSGSSVNEYVRTNLTRCYVLINDWHWRRPEQPLNAMFDFFGKHGLKSLRREAATGSADFLQDFTTASHLMLQSNENSFHIALKCLATGLRGMTVAYPEKKVRSFVFRRIPNHGRTYPKDQPLEEESLAALRNHHDLLCTLYCAAPPSCRPKLDHIRNLVSHESSHREACRVSVRAWSNLTTFQLSTDEQYEAAKPFALWYKEIMHQTLKQYRLAKTEADDYLNSGALNGATEMSVVLVRQTMERNQKQVIATLRDGIAGLNQAIERAKDQNTLSNFLIDSDIVHLLELPHFGDNRLLDVIRDTLIVFRRYASLQKSQVKHQQVSQSRSEESQDYGDFPDLDDLDDDEASQPVQITPPPQSPSLDFIQGPLWHLMSNAFGAERSPDDNLLMDCIDTWVSIAGDQVMSGGKQWSHYMDSFSQVSWQQLRQTEQTRKFGPYFMAALIAYDPSAYEEHRSEFLTALLLSLADRESMLRFQHQLLDAILRADEGHPLLRNLPFFRAEHDGGFDITADTLRSRRLSLISSLLSNMREDVYSTTLQEPARASEVKRQYATMLKDFMGRLKSNYQQLQQGSIVTGAYVEFVQKIVQFLKQYTGDVCPVLPFFTDSVAFPLPATDPTYVVGRLCGYAPKATEPGTAKQLSVFIQTVAQQAAADSQQPYLVNQLKTALCTEEAPVADRVALRTVLLQSIFPAYIEESFSSRVGHVIVNPILQCLPQVMDKMIFDLRVSQNTSLSMAVHSIVSIAHAFIRATEQLKGDSLLLQQSSILSSLTHMFYIAKPISRMLDYIVDRTITTTLHSRSPLVTYLEEFSSYIVQVIEGTTPDDVPSYRGDAHAETLDAKHIDILAFCKNGLQSSLKSNWKDDGTAIWFGQGRARKEVQSDNASNEDERSRLMEAIHSFQDTLLELSGEGLHGEGTIPLFSI